MLNVCDVVEDPLSGFLKAKNVLCKSKNKKTNECREKHDLIDYNKIGLNDRDKIWLTS
jgi:hypothetical protein